MNPLISIIVPIYNTEEYLQKCLDSLVSQTMEEIEIILVDDGSEDGSAAICDAMAKKDPRIRVRHNPHKGVSAARNVGLEMSRGKYIMFADSDDWVEPDFCKIPFEIAEQTDSDLVVFRIWFHCKDGELILEDKYPHEGLSSKEDVLTKNWELTGSYSVNKLFRRELFENVRYPEGRLFEDIAIMSDVIYSAKRVYVLNDQLYHYDNIREGSTTNTVSKEIISDYYEFAFKRIDSLKKWGYDCADEDEYNSFKYLIEYGMREKYSDRCQVVVSKVKKPCKDFSWKQKMLFYIYKKSKSMFNAISAIGGRRL